MRIAVVANDEMARALGDGTTIDLAGEIQADTPQRLREALAALPRDRSWTFVRFNSPGGDLFAAMEMGRILRAAGAITQVGGYGGAPGKGTPSICLSACSLAYLGGVYRYMPQGSVYGVHRAYRTSEPSRSDMDTGQIVASAMATYIHEMGVDTRLLALSVKAGKDGMYLLSEAETEALGVVNNGRKEPTWSIEVVDGGTYLRGAQETVLGEGKIMFSCVGPVVQMMSVYTAGTAKAASLAAAGWTHAMLVNDEGVPLGQPQRIQASGRFINTVFALPAAALQKVASATKVGHAMYAGPGARFSLGYQVDIDAVAKAKVATYMGNCLR